MVLLWHTDHQELLADLETPVSAFLKLRQAGARFLLETVEPGAALGRYSFIGLHPLLEIVCDAAEAVAITPDGRRFPVPLAGDPTALLSAVLRLLRPAAPQGPGDLLGGAVGYLPYEYVRWIERVPVQVEEGRPEARFLLPRSVVTFDHQTRKLHLRCMRPQPVDSPVAAGSLEEHAAQILLHAASVVADTSGELQLLGDLLAAPLPEAESATAPATTFSPRPGREAYVQSVRVAQDHIRQGDIFQVVLSQSLTGRLGVPPFQVYRALRMLNPSPYLFYLDFTPTVLVGSSPEVLVKLENRTATLRPIAGTRRRGQDPAEDRQLAEELLANEKERAEHIMLVDLGRNDLGRVCDYGSVQVTEFMSIERYSHVMHMVSYVTGTLRQGLDCFDLLRATFPAGTVSGAPKVRAMEIIDELEHGPRGPYSGAVGYFGPGGDMDLCITIRTLFCEGDQVTLQAGAGVVADSDPEREHEECQEKMQALQAAIRLAEQGLR